MQRPTQLVAHHSNTEGVRELCSVERFPDAWANWRCFIRRGASTEGALHQLCGLKDPRWYPSQRPSNALKLARLLVDAGEDVNAVRNGRLRTKMVPLRGGTVLGPSDRVTRDAKTTTLYIFSCHEALRRTGTRGSGGARTGRRRTRKV